MSQPAFCANCTVELNNTDVFAGHGRTDINADNFQAKTLWQRSTVRSDGAFVVKNKFVHDMILSRIDRLREQVRIREPTKQHQKADCEQRRQQVRRSVLK
jgi:hypothetical protein